MNYPHGSFHRNMTYITNGSEVSEKGLAFIKPVYDPSSPPSEESATVKTTLKSLSLSEHPEGGYYSLTDLAPTSIPSPYPAEARSEYTVSLTGGLREGYDASSRLLSSTIFYYLTPARPMGSFHANRSRIIHTLHRGRGRYVCIHPDGRVETFIVGQDVEKGEKLMWVVEGDVWKASFLLDRDGQDENEGLLISETVVPGFEYTDHEFLTTERFQKLLPSETAEQLKWLVREH